MATVIRRKDSPNWFARFQVDGKDFTITTGTSSKRDAETVLKRLVEEKKGTGSVSDAFDQVMRLLDQQAHDAVEPDRRRELMMMRQDMARRIMGAQAAKLSLADSWQAWLDNPKKRNPGTGTIENYHSEWERFLKWTDGKGLRFLHELTPALAEDYAADLWKSNVSSGTYNAHLNFLKSLFRVLKVKAGLVVNPWDEIPTLQKEQEGRRMLSPAELAKVCGTATGSRRYMIAIGLYTGMRLGDVVNLRWDSVHFGQGFIEITPMKTRRMSKKIRLPIHPVLETMLRTLRKTSNGEYVFPAEHATYGAGRTDITKKFQAFLESCSIKTKEIATNGHRRKAIVRVGFHSLRHSFVSLCAANRVPQVAIMELVGHGSPAMTALYSHSGDEQKTKAIAALPTMVFDGEVVAPRKKRKHVA